MKNKSHISNWAIALCAIAVFSVAGTAYGVRLPDPTPAVTLNPGGTVKPGSELPVKNLQPLPPIAPPVASGTYTGTVIAD
jgi:hypothetical protein